MDCNGCTLCCRLLPVKELGKAAGDQCKDCTEGQGCNIHATRPDVCREFLCAYAQVKKASAAMRPDRCGVVFERLEPDLMIGTVDPGATVFNHMAGQVDAFRAEGINVVLLRKGMPIVYAAEGADPGTVLSRLIRRTA